MSMIHDQMWRLKATAKRLDASGDMDAAREIYLAVETINDLHTKLTAANMERSSAWYSGGWIPVEERSPEEYTEVLVWYEYRKGGSSDGKMVQTYGIGWCSMNGWHGDVYGLDARCIAWMPLPEPYKED